MKKHAVMLLFLLLLTSTALCLAQIEVQMNAFGDDVNQVITFAASCSAPEEAELVAALQERLDGKFFQPEANRILARVLGRGGESTIFQKGSLFETDAVVSLHLIWDGQQVDGMRDSRPISLFFNRETGEELPLSALFSEWELAKGRLEEIIEISVLPDISDYLENAVLLPMPEDCFSFDQSGLTVYYDTQHYRTFSGECGAVNFAWYEIADLLDPDGPAALFISAQADADAIKAQIAAGSFGQVFSVLLGTALGDVLGEYELLTDPDYTRNSLLYQFEPANLRGYAVEIPKFAMTAEEDTPVSAIRSERIDFYGLKIGWTGEEDIRSLLGEPIATVDYDEQKAEDMMLKPGTSLVYQFGGNYLEVHLDGEQLLSALILRTEMPE